MRAALKLHDPIVKSLDWQWYEERMYLIFGMSVDELEF